MQELSVYDVEQGALLVATATGERFRVRIDDAVLAQLRGARSAGAARPKVAPREVQAHIRAGLSADEVAALTGASLDYVERFEGPVMAEREHVVAQALNVPVELPDGTSDSFGSVIRARLGEAEAGQERWAAWKDVERGWLVKLTFVAGGVERDARWDFDPRTRALTPANTDAVTLSHQEPEQAALIPRLRAVPFVDRAPAPQPGEAERFDSGAFFVDAPVPAGETVPADPGPDAAELLPTVAADAFPQPLAETSDLLEALRRRRGEREAMPSGEEEARAAHPSTGSIRLVEVPIAGLEEDADEVGDDYRVPTAELQVTADGARASGKNGRRGRPAMPSWDEIVFGARGEDD